MPSNKSVSEAPITQLLNCRILRDHRLQREDLWVREGKILDPEKLFFDEQAYADERVDCGGAIVAPGFIDVQLNGGYGVDFSQASDHVGAGVSLVARKLLEHGVTSFCPTLVTSPTHVYHKVLPQVKVQDGGRHGAGVLGVHLEGPFISAKKKGAHPEGFLRTFSGGGAAADLIDVYGGLDNVAVVTLAPELEGSQPAVDELRRRGVTVSLGHSVANLSQAEDAVRHGASFITHLFNAMLPFHHRDPGIVGLLTSDQIPPGRVVFYGMIADGIHTNPAALRIAHRAHPAGTQTLSGSIATMDACVRHFKRATGCSVEEALEAASLHPAQLLGISERKGTLDFGSHADFVLLDDELNVEATFISGQEVWRKTTQEQQ
ncbi:N-acetylglucosamine-6-phosphate deacetylase isoform X2 [Phyllopteryx taeniolatus]|uniref:N-acetylglucosamine-6-phosphate deacetylase isoform X2 n=1 Tax=Phyllopteryx taeniolatus TaxID=161469 RepID=UPI002AD5124F|nr:N-acetylglucosamine-6-phosphate deacetylase isoform X2 [Phyllopteryx taeniolatus]